MDCSELKPPEHTVGAAELVVIDPHVMGVALVAVLDEGLHVLDPFLG
jgi:hypothetical protein